MNRRKFLQLPGVALFAWAASKVKLAPEERVIRVGRRYGMSLRGFPGLNDEFERLERAREAMMTPLEFDRHGNEDDYQVTAEWPDTIIVTHHNGEAWKSNDFGDNWHQISDANVVDWERACTNDWPHHQDWSYGDDA